MARPNVIHVSALSTSSTAPPSTVLPAKVEVKLTNDGLEPTAPALPVLLPVANQAASFLSNWFGPSSVLPTPPQSQARGLLSSLAGLGASAADRPTPPVRHRRSEASLASPASTRTGAAPAESEPSQIAPAWTRSPGRRGWLSMSTPAGPLTSAEAVANAPASPSEPLTRPGHQRKPSRQPSISNDAPLRREAGAKRDDAHAQWVGREREATTARERLLALTGGRGR
jgi:hypothetical protein